MLKFKDIKIGKRYYWDECVNMPSREITGVCYGKNETTEACYMKCKNNDEWVLYPNGTIREKSKEQK